MIHLAVLVGLTGALLQALSYILSRRFVSQPGRSVLQLMALAHIWMAVASLAILPFIWRTPTAGWIGILLPLFGSAGAYFAGQYLFFLALRTAPASRLAPLLGLKILMVPLLTLAFRNETITVRQWCAVGLALLAAFLLNRVGGSIPWKALLAIFATCVGYSVSDLSIAFLIPAIDPNLGLHASILALVWTYIVCGLYGLIMLPRLQGLRKKDWFDSFCYAGAWYASMGCLFYTIALSSLVLAVVLQSTRAVISVGLAALLAHLGHVKIEHVVAPGERWRQAAAATLMCLAIALYVLSRS